MKYIIVGKEFQKQEKRHSVQESNMKQILHACLQRLGDVCREYNYHNCLTISSYYCKEDTSSFVQIHSLLTPGPAAVETALRPILDNVREAQLRLQVWAD